MSQWQEFSTAFRAARAAAQLTQRETGDRIGLDASVVSKIEHGVRGPKSRDEVIAWEDALGVRDAALLDAAGYQHPPVRRLPDGTQVVAVGTASESETAQPVDVEREAVKNIVEILRRAADEIERTIRDIGSREK